jgi:hypothetical protein
MRTKKPVEQQRLWARRFYFRSFMPMEFTELARQKRSDLLTIATLFKFYNGDEMRDWNRDELIRFIAGNQQDLSQYHLMEPMPGTSLPVLSNQKYKEIFGDRLKSDPARLYDKAWP